MKNSQWWIQYYEVVVKFLSLYIIIKFQLLLQNSLYIRIYCHFNFYYKIIIIIIKLILIAWV